MNRFCSNSIVAAILLFSIFKPVSAYYTNMPASVVVGQSGFGNVSSNQGGTLNANTLSNPYTAIVVNGKLIVSDFSNHRVLIYNQIPTLNNVRADVVIGQVDFTSSSANQGGTRAANTLNGPDGLYSDGTKLFIADSINNRVLIFNSIPTTNNVSADVVIGQASFASGSANQGGTRAANTFSSPVSVYVEGGKLFVADNANNRVLIFNSIPTTNNVSADVVIGQIDFASGSADQGGSASANTLDGPTDAFVTEGKLVVADPVNSRVLIFNSIPTSNNASADVVIGQADFTSTSSNQGGSVGANTLVRTRHPWVRNGRLFIPEDNGAGNNRVLVFNKLPTSNNASADLVLGQSSFSGSSANQGGTPAANTLNRPTGGLDTGDRMIIVDRINSRILIYNNILSSPHLSVSKVEEMSGDSGKLKISGSTEIGERGRYSLSSVVSSVNGLGYGNVTSKDNGRDNGDGKTLYEFTHEFEPWINNNGDRNTWKDKGYTVALKAISSNAEEDEVLLFSPFVLKAMSKDTSSLEFSVPSVHWSTLVDKLSYYTVEVKKTGSKEWTNLFTPIPTSLTTNTSPDFTVTHNSSTGTITIKSTKPLSSGEYRIQAVSKTGNTFSSNTVSHTSSTTSYLPSLTLTTSWFPLQINKITGTNLSILSSFSTYTPKPLTSSTLTPTVSGIAPSYSTVYLQVTNSTLPTQKKLYKTTTTSNTSFSIPISLYPKSTLDSWVTNQHNTTVLTPISLTTNVNLAVLGEYVNKPTIKSGLW